MGFRRSLSVFLLGAGLALSAYAADEQATWSENAAEQLPKLDGFQKEKNYAGAVVFLDEQLKKSKPESYDEVMFLQFKAKFLMMANTLKEAVAPFERSLQIGIPKKYLKLDDIQWTRFYLAQIHYQEGAGKDTPKDEQKRRFLKALDYVEQWTAASTKTNSDVTQFHAQILFNIAQITGDGKEPNLDYLKRAEVVLRKGMTETVKPKEVLFLIMVATLQQQSKWVEAAEYLELLVKMQPNNKNNWGQLFATYYQLGLDDKDKTKAFENNLRAVLTMDRAQKFGIMNTQKDNFNRVGIYFNINQHEKATDLLDAGLRDGSIEDTQKNWEILAYSYQQINKSDKAVDTLLEALKRYPDKGSLMFSIAQNYYNLDKPKQAYEAAIKAIAIGNLEKPQQVHSFAAYMAFELRLFEEALAAVQKAMSFTEAKKDSQLPKLEKAIKDSILEREQNKKAIEQQHKNR
jgi:tetratricopeptide (TPR) repeat protein